MQRLIQCAARRYTTELVHQHIFNPVTLRIHIPRSFSSIKPLSKDGHSLPTWIRWYDQDTPNSPIVRDLEDEPEEDDKDDQEAAALKAQIAELDKELEELQGATFGSLTPEDRSKVEAAVGDEVILEDGTEQLKKLDRPPHLPDLTLNDAPDDAQNVMLRHLTSWLYKVAQEPERAVCQKELRRWYNLCKQSVPSFFSFLSDASWEVLWQSHHNLNEKDRFQSTKLIIFLEDVLSCQRELNLQQTMAYIESLMKEGRYQKAINWWQKEEVAMRAKQDFSHEFENLIVRLHSEGNQPQAAENLALKALKLSEPATARIFVPVIASWARCRDNRSLKHAWDLYVRLRNQLSEHITAKDYDSLSMCFLKVGRTDLALAIFKDLMLADRSSEHDSQQLYHKASGYVGMLRLHSNNMEELMNVSFTALTVLPPEFHHKYFFASWMKRLIGIGEIDAASSIVGIMHQRGIMPDPMHLNGIIGAWFRDGGTKDEERALQTGWAMIRQRLDLVEKRRGSILSASSPSGPPVLEESLLAVPLDEHGAVPPASIETFSILLLYYTRRQMWIQVQHIQTAMTMAEIQPNSYVMNHLLYAELRNRDSQSAWNLYKKMSVEVRPDIETFACLWDCEKANLDSLHRSPSNLFPEPRALFCEMMGTITITRDKDRERVRKEIQGEYYQQIIRCFCLANDLQGIVVALHTFKNFLGIYPDTATIRIIMLQVARQGEVKAGRTRYQRRRFRDHPDRNTNLLNATKIMVLLTQQRAEELHERNIHIDAVDEKDEQLWLLTKLLRGVIEKKEMLGQSDIEAIEKTAWKMGVGGITIVDPLLPVEDMGVSVEA
ncbi:hypothetical protein MMC14_000820 [Varicellaria rhodocarpa]|nr:hypothetical protein [Varicellaria rhodocarpa]